MALESSLTRETSKTRTSRTSSRRRRFGLVDADAAVETEADIGRCGKRSTRVDFFFAVLAACSTRTHANCFIIIIVAADAAVLANALDTAVAGAA